MICLNIITFYFLFISFKWANVIVKSYLTANLFCQTIFFNHLRLFYILSNHIGETKIVIENHSSIQSPHFRVIPKIVDLVQIRYLFVWNLFQIFHFIYHLSIISLRCFTTLPILKISLYPFWQQFIVNWFKIYLPITSLSSLGKFLPSFRHNVYQHFSISLPTWTKPITIKSTWYF